MPAFKIIGGTRRPIGAVWRNISGVWKSGLLWRNINGTWKSVSDGLAATISPNPNSTFAGTSTITSGISTLTASGGIPGYTYSWLFDSGDNRINKTTGAGQSTAFTTTGMTSGESRSAVFKGTVTDSTLAHADAYVSVDINRF